MRDRLQDAFAEIHADSALIDSTKAYLHQEAKKWRHKSKRGGLPARAGAIAAAVVLVIGFFPYYLYFTAAAYVSIDVNPSVELTLNRFDRVIDTYAFNESGAHILRADSLRGKGYDEATRLVLSAIEANGYMAGDTLISVTVQAASNEKEKTLCAALLQFINEQIRPVRESTQVEVFSVTAEVWSHAHAGHMSPSKFLAMQALMEVDETATIEAYTEVSIHQIRQRTQECRDGHNTGSNGGGFESGSQKGHGHGQENDHFGTMGGHQ